MSTGCWISTPVSSVFFTSPGFISLAALSSISSVMTSASSIGSKNANGSFMVSAIVRSGVNNMRPESRLTTVKSPSPFIETVSSFFRASAIDWKNARTICSLSVRSLKKSVFLSMLTNSPRVMILFMIGSLIYDRCYYCLMLFVRDDA